MAINTLVDLINWLGKPQVLLECTVTNAARSFQRSFRRSSSLPESPGSDVGNGGCFGCIAGEGTLIRTVTSP